MTTPELKERIVKSIAQPVLWVWIRTNWGQRCEHRDPDCYGCKAWMAFDFLFELNPNWPDDRDEHEQDGQVYDSGATLPG